MLQNDISLDSEGGRIYIHSFIVGQVVPPLLLVFTVYIEFSQNTISQKAWDTVFMICSMVYMLCTHDMSQDGLLFSIVFINAN